MPQLRIPARGELQGDPARRANRIMPRRQPTLHEAMQTILLDQPNHAATLETLREENIRRDLYRQRKGDGPYPLRDQFKLRPFIIRSLNFRPRIRYATSADAAASSQTIAISKD